MFYCIVLIHKCNVHFNNVINNQFHPMSIKWDNVINQNHRLSPHTWEQERENVLSKKVNKHHPNPCWSAWIKKVHSFCPFALP